MANAAAMLDALPAVRLRLAMQKHVAEKAKLNQPTTVLEWAQWYRRLEGQPFTLDRFLPLKAIYEDDHPRIVIIKPAQRGVSEMLVNMANFALDRGADVWAKGQKDGLNVCYIFPTK